MNPLPTNEVMDRYFLEARSKLLDVAAILDRINRGADSMSVENDPRSRRIREALDILLDRSGGRAERIQKVFSLEYESGWQRPRPGNGR
jgi:hypothetical protein